MRTFLGQRPNLAEDEGRQTSAVGRPLREFNAQHSAANISKSDDFKKTTTEEGSDWRWRFKEPHC